MRMLHPAARATLALASLLGTAPILAADTDDTPAAAAAGTIENSVVKIFATLRQPDLNKPWTKHLN